MPAQDGDQVPSGVYWGWQRVPFRGNCWSYRRVVWACSVSFAAAGLIVLTSLIFQPTNGFDLARSAVDWVQAGRAGQGAACLVTTELLVTAAQRPRWRRTIALTVWAVIALQFGLFLLVRTQYPGNSCTPRPGWAAITLTDTDPGPTVTVPPGAQILVTVPGWAGPDTDVTAATGGILREECTVVPPGGGRRVVFAAIRPGTTEIGGTVAPTPAMMPAWSGEVIVRSPRG